MAIMDATRSLVIRTCRRCNKEKEQEEFVKNHVFSSGYDTICKVCNRQHVRDWRTKNPEKRKEQLRRESKKDYNHNKHLKATYGITRDDYLVMFENQKGCCAICGRHQLEFEKRLFVDHNHTTGQVRALLCQHCNMMIGAAKEDTSILERGIQYINSFKDDS